MTYTRVLANALWLLAATLIPSGEAGAQASLPSSPSGKTLMCSSPRTATHASHRYALTELPLSLRAEEHKQAPCTRSKTMSRSSSTAYRRNVLGARQSCGRLCVLSPGACFQLLRCLPRPARTAPLRMDEASPATGGHGKRDMERLGATVRKYTAHASCSERLRNIDVLQLSVVFAPLVLPALAFFNFENAVTDFHVMLDILSNDNWVQVDGGISKAASLTPVMNGIVLPSVSVALSTLTAITVSSLRVRQLELRKHLNTEASLLRSLHSATETLLPRAHCGTDGTRALLLLQQYVNRVLSECAPGADLQELALGAANSELDGLTRLFHRARQMRAARKSDEKGDEYAAWVEPRFYATTEVFPQIYLRDIEQVRSKRLATLQTTFPPEHWLGMTTLGAFILVAFLLAADQDLLRFLAPLQLRLLFAVLVGTLVGIACVCADLNAPFRGAFRISRVADQFGSIRAEIEQNLHRDDG
mmetsp:Transcript_42775/g.89352  ORF Transcript_42775/g.89352 Transcript_42775/m.89352 type:complete len:475 (-) Transcript_42775:422-1846(-)